MLFEFGSLLSAHWTALVDQGPFASIAQLVVIAWVSNKVNTISVFGLAEMG